MSKFRIDTPFDSKPDRSFSGAKVGTGHAYALDTTILADLGELVGFASEAFSAASLSPLYKQELSLQRGSLSDLIEQSKPPLKEVFLLIEGEVNRVASELAPLPLAASTIASTLRDHHSDEATCFLVCELAQKLICTYKTPSESGSVNSGAVELLNRAIEFARLVDTLSAPIDDTQQQTVFGRLGEITSDKHVWCDVAGRLFAGKVHDENIERIVTNLFAQAESRADESNRDLLRNIARSLESPESFKKIARYLLGEHYSWKADVGDGLTLPDVLDLEP